MTPVTRGPVLAVVATGRGSVLRFDARNPTAPAAHARAVARVLDLHAHLFRDARGRVVGHPSERGDGRRAKSICAECGTVPSGTWCATVTAIGNELERRPT